MYDKNEGGVFFSGIASIEQIPTESVSRDVITVESDNHTYIGGQGFVVSTYF